MHEWVEVVPGYPRGDVNADCVTETIHRRRVGACEVIVGRAHQARRLTWQDTLALRAAELLLPTLEEALREVGEEDGQAFRTDESLLNSTGAPAALVGGWMGMAASGDASQRNDEHVYAALAGALDAVDRGTLALSLSYAAPGSAERLERARAARDAFSDALERLDEQAASVRASEPWRHWHDEARRGYDEADERVIDLGG